MGMAARATYILPVTSCVAALEECPKPGALVQCPDVTHRVRLTGPDMLVSHTARQRVRKCRSCWLSIDQSGNPTQVQGECRPVIHQTPLVFQLDTACYTQCPDQPGAQILAEYQFYDYVYQVSFFYCCPAGVADCPSFY